MISNILTFNLTERKTAKMPSAQMQPVAFVNDDANRAVLRACQSQHPGPVTALCGSNNVDLKAAAELGITVVRVPVYSQKRLLSILLGCRIHEPTSVPVMQTFPCSV